MNTIRMSNSLNPDQARQIVWPDLGQNCLQRLSAEDTGRQRKGLTIPASCSFDELFASLLAKIGFPYLA